MRTFIYCILIILSPVTFFSCSQEKSIVVDDSVAYVSDTEPEQELHNDYAILTQYLQWLDSIEYLDTDTYDLSVLRSTEKNRDTLMLLDFLISNYNNIKLYDGFPYQPADLVKSVYAIDFNGDSLPDIIYNGPTGGEPSITQFFLNRGDHYERVFSHYQSIIEMDYSDNKLHSFTLINPGCCADPQFVEYYFSVEYNDDIPAFVLDKTIGYLSNTEKPQTSLTTSIDFVVTSDNAKLRSDCYKFDNVEHHVYESDGNSIAKYKSGSKGTLLGTKKDENDEWVYVIMNSDNKIESCEFPTFMEQPTELKGWMLKADTDL